MANNWPDPEQEGKPLFPNRAADHDDAVLTFRRPERNHAVKAAKRKAAKQARKINAKTRRRR